MTIQISHILKTNLLLICSLLVVGCTTVQAVKLPIPPPLNLPKIQKSELSCLSNGTVGKLVKRDKLLKARIRTLKGILGSTH